MNLGDLNKVWEFKALKKKPREDEARKILGKVANQVQPIMTRRKWRVKLLSEFCPTNPRLLGVNVNWGVQVKLRLRRVNHDEHFLSYHEFLTPCSTSFATMPMLLITQVSISFGMNCERNARRVCQRVEQGFDIPGKRLGGLSCQPPLSSLRTTAATAAEKECVQVLFYPQDLIVLVVIAALCQILVQFKLMIFGVVPNPQRV